MPLFQKIEYKGALQTDLKKLEISNQGGLIMFRYANDKLVYCIQPDVRISTSEYILYDFSRSGYSEEDRKNMELISYYGYRYDEEKIIIRYRIRNPFNYRDYYWFVCSWLDKKLSGRCTGCYTAIYTL